MARAGNRATWDTLVNFIVLVLCGLPGIVLEFGVSDPSTPFQRGFYCDDDSIRYPYRKSTISTSQATVISLVIPLVGMIIIEWLLFRRYRSLGELAREVPMYRGARLLCLNVHSFLVALVAAYLPFVFAAGATLSLTNCLKYMLGRPRPHFLAVCQPNATELTQRCQGDDGYHAYLEDIPCSPEADRALLLDARLSFPSGHASCAASCFVYFALYLQFRMVWKTPSLLRPFLQILSVTGAVMIAASRVSDYKHHWSDVFAGFFLGLIIATLVAYFVSNLYYFDNPTAHTNGSSTKEFSMSPSDNDLATMTSNAAYPPVGSAQFQQSGSVNPSNV